MGAYPQMPYEAITEEQYNRMVRVMLQRKAWWLALTLPPSRSRRP